MAIRSETSTVACKRLEGAGLIDRRRSPADERQVRVSLTDKGRGLRTEATTVPPAILAASGCDAATLGRLKQELGVVRDHLLKDGQRAG